MTENLTRPVLLWFRKDLRLDDNHALHTAAASGKPVIPVFIYQPNADEGGPLGEAQKWWLHHSLESLQADLQSRGSRLILIKGKPAEVLPRLVKETQAEAVFWNRCHDPVADVIDREVKAALADNDVELRAFPGLLLHDPDGVKTGGGTPFRVYSPFWRAFEAKGEPDPPFDAPQKIGASDRTIASEDLSSWKLLPTAPNWAVHFSDLWAPGEAGARARLEEFVQHRIKGYGANRDLPAIDGTSRLSPHLAFGEISPARVWDATRRLGKHVPADDVKRFRQELVWREFSYHLLHHFPKLGSENWNPRFDRFAWQADNKQFVAWKRGRTGYPIVDAGMRQLWKHGYVHNRVRMIVGSFMIKDLMIDWRAGEQWFRDTLVDADPASNAASWQWVAGSGADASPFFRIFNPITQGEKFDPNGDYIRAYVPELAKLDSSYIHKPFAAPKSVLEKAGVVLGSTYPEPIVDHGAARTRALQAYSAVKGQA